MRTEQVCPERLRGDKDMQNRGEKGRTSEDTVREVWRERDRDLAPGPSLKLLKVSIYRFKTSKDKLS